MGLGSLGGLGGLGGKEVVLLSNGLGLSGDGSVLLEEGLLSFLQLPLEALGLGTDALPVAVELVGLLGLGVEL